VRSYAYDAGEKLVLFDPLSPPPEIAGLADARPVTVLLTCHWHQRSSEELIERLGVTVYAPQAMIDDVRAPARPYRHGDTLPGGVEALGTGYPDEAVLWIPACGALVTGDVFLGGERGFHVQPDSWLPEELTHDRLREALEPLLELPVELLLPTHGDPVLDEAKSVLERALRT
jgi:glyoxylase-like metal-dependent hydrolase (beta-lactamase superfamily II)